jgi:hypothetical protein
MIELHNSSGQLDFTRVSPEAISEMPEANQAALLALITAHEAHEAAIVRRNAAVKRLGLAIENEKLALAANEEAQSPIPSPVTAMEAQLQRPLTASELQHVNSQHKIRVAALKDLEARRISAAAYANQYVNQK